MPTVRDILKTKGTTVTTIHHEATVLEAATLMNERRIGAVIVMNGDLIVGVFSERDLMTRVIVPRREPAGTKVRDVMTSEVRVCSVDSPLEECRAAMTHHKIRHLPAVDGDGRLVGLISIGDIVAREIAQQEETIRFLHEYMQGPN
ncbi:MAG TPA: CBS domain-containing protein [Phycisphaerae bacterium]|nr:CBS domain-containing protein [Phycisphaerae bacterium]